jgi:TonB family protein
MGKPIIFVVLAALATGGVAMADITASDVKRVMAEHNGEVKACYERHAKGSDDASGKVTLDIGVTKDGKVDSVKIEAPGVDSKPFERCVDRKVKKWRFPNNEQGGTVVTIPYKFYFSASGR